MIFPENIFKNNILVFFFSIIANHKETSITHKSPFTIILMEKLQKWKQNSSTLAASKSSLNSCGNLAFISLSLGRDIPDAFDKYIAMLNRVFFLPKFAETTLRPFSIDCVTSSTKMKKFKTDTTNL